MLKDQLKYKTIGWCVVSISILLFMTESLFGANGSVEISWSQLIFGLLGGLALFLYGIELLSDGMKKSAGNKLRSILKALTKNRVIGLLCGAFLTVMVQSSSATTVMLVSFVQAGLMSFAQAMGVILGSDIGTTITAQMIAFKLTDYALVIIAVGFALKMFGRNQKLRDFGEAVIGFGILFYGMKLMSDAMKPLRVYPGFMEILKELENPILGVFVGALFTALIQSSAAFIGILIVLAEQNLISLTAGVPLVFGANIGTCITAGLASIGTSREAKRVALAHVIFKIAGVFLFIFWIPGFILFIEKIAAEFGSTAARQIANAHTIFNLSLAFIFLPFTGIFTKLVFKILPEKEKDRHQKLQVSHLDYNRVSTPALAINLARIEVARMSRILREMLDLSIIPFIQAEKKIDTKYPKLSLVEGIHLREKKLDFLEEKIEKYLLTISKHTSTDEDASEIFRMLSIINDLESIGDLLHRNIVPLISKKQMLVKDFSADGKEEIEIYHQKVSKQIHLLEEAFKEQDLSVAHIIMGKERKYLDLDLQYRARHLDRLARENLETVTTHEVHMELMDLMKQVIVYTCNIATTFQNKNEDVYSLD